VLYKPPRLHSAPLGPGEQTLLGWCARLYPEVLAVRGRQPREGGLLHRLDYETHGLVLVARLQVVMDDLVLQQKAGRFIKEYGALSARSGPPDAALSGFPPPPEGLCRPAADDTGRAVPGTGPRRIESRFRPYGPGRKEVRPVLEEGRGRSGFYTTELIGQSLPGEYRSFRIRISRGFRHQIRCHLAWIGCPILNDDLYGGGKAAPEAGPILALRAEALSFFDPPSGEWKRYAITALAEAGIFLRPL
jgi:23S rRNA pseudouridine1911/1915/1917 synthase